MFHVCEVDWNFTYYGLRIIIIETEILKSYVFGQAKLNINRPVLCYGNLREKNL